MRFRVEATSVVGDLAYVFARQLDAGSFDLTDDSTLGGVPIRNWIDLPRKILENGTLDTGVFALVLQDARDLNLFVEGSEVELVP